MIDANEESRPTPPQISVTFESEYSSKKDPLSEKYIGKDIDRRNLPPEDYLHKIKNQFNTEDQQLFLDALGVVTRIAETSPRVHKLMVDGKTVPPELQPDFIIQLPIEKGNIPTIVLSRDTASELVSIMNVVKYKLQHKEQHIINKARQDVVDFINSGKPITNKLSDRMKAVGQKIQHSLANQVLGREATQNTIRKKVETDITEDTLGLPMTIGFPLASATTFLNDGVNPIDVYKPIDLALFISTATIFSWGMDTIDIHPHVAEELRDAWLEKIDSIVEKANN